MTTKATLATTAAVARWIEAKLTRVRILNCRSSALVLSYGLGGINSPGGGGGDDDENDSVSENDGNHDEPLRWEFLPKSPQRPI